VCSSDRSKSNPIQTPWRRRNSRHEPVVTTVCLTVEVENVGLSLAEFNKLLVGETIEPFGVRMLPRGVCCQQPHSILCISACAAFQENNAVVTVLIHQYCTVRFCSVPRSISNRPRPHNAMQVLDDATVRVTRFVS
jgi:hypothetical protein